MCSGQESEDEADELLGAGKRVLQGMRLETGNGFAKGAKEDVFQYDLVMSTFLEPDRNLTCHMALELLKAHGSKKRYSEDIGSSHVRLT